jgi:hypothetical protein
MPDIRNFRKYLEELSGNNILRKKIASLERANGIMEKKLDELKDDIKLLKKSKAISIPKKKGRKPKPIIKVIELEMAKKKDQSMKVTEIIKMLKTKKVKTKAHSLYSSVAAALSKNPKFEKVGPGEFKLSGAKKASKKSAKSAE